MYEILGCKDPPKRGWLPSQTAMLYGRVPWNGNAHRFCILFWITPYRAASTWSPGPIEPHSIKLTFSVDWKTFAFWIERQIQKAELAKERYKHGMKTGGATCVFGSQQRNWIWEGVLPKKGCQQESGGSHLNISTSATTKVREYISQLIPNTRVLASLWFCLHVVLTLNCWEWKWWFPWPWLFRKWRLWQRQE